MEEIGLVVASRKHYYLNNHLLCSYCSLYGPYIHWLTLLTRNKCKIISFRAKFWTEVWLLIYKRITHSYLETLLTKKKCIGHYWDALCCSFFIFQQHTSRNITRKKEVPAIALCYRSSVFMGPSAILLWPGDHKRSRQRIHLFGIWQSGSGCETLSQLKGLRSVSTLRCLYSLIQRAKTGWQRGLQQQPSKTHMQSVTRSQRKLYMFYSLESSQPECCWNNPTKEIK